MRLDLVSMTEVRWPRLLGTGADLLGRSLTASVDAVRLLPGALDSYLAVLAEFQQPGADPLRAIRKEHRPLLHVQASFLVEAPADVGSLLEAGGIFVLRSQEGPFIATGSLLSWVDRVISGTRSSKADMRLLCCGLLLLFEREGLGEVWGTYEKIPLADGTFELKEKR